MILLERPVRANRQSDAVQRQGIALPNGRQVAVRRTSRAHVVLDVNFEEANVGRCICDCPVVLGLETDAPALRYAIF